ncbi:MAG: hypothetical protein IPK83_02910 [Planctomycetes bacterium]|nr:hypothetical protein [Planctomycetota bacterium]
MVGLPLAIHWSHAAGQTGEPSAWVRAAQAALYVAVGALVIQFVWPVIQLNLL